MWYVYAVEYYSATKWNEIESFVETWIVQDLLYRVKYVGKRKTNVY